MEKTKVQILGDSILQGVQVNPDNKKYYIKNDIDFNMLCDRYHFTLKNDAKFGCTVTKGARILKKLLDTGLNCNAVIMDFGGNDCDLSWKSISENPSGEFSPKTPIKDFIEQYSEIIHTLKGRGITPILCNLPPLEPQRFFDWWCRDLNKANVMQWLGSITTIYSHQESYSHAVEQLAQKENVPLIDIRGAFLQHRKLGELICEDGTHPNSKGQKVITQAIESFLTKNLSV